MMLFKDYHVYPMFIGIKIYTRRFWKKPRAKVGSTHLCKHRMLDEFFFGYLTVEQVYRQNIGMMTCDDAYLEGGYSLPMFKRTAELVTKKPWEVLQVMDSPFVIRFRFARSDMIDPNGGDTMMKEYRDAWVNHLKTVARDVGMLK
jgi:hypothetical protein